MATIRTRAELATNVMRDLGLIAAEDSPSATDQQYIIARYEEAIAELEDQDMVYWADDEIPVVIFDPLTKLVGLTVGTSFGVPSLAENLHQARDMFLRRIRRHTGKKSAGQSVTVEDF